MVVGSETTFWVVAVAALLVTTAVLLSGALFGVGAVIRGRSRGYDPTVLTTALLCAMLGAAALPVAVAWRAGYLSRRSPTTDLSPIVGAGLCCVAAAVAAMATWLVVCGLPARVNRRPGMRRRRHRYRVWSHVAAAMTVAITVWAWLHVTVETTFRAALVGLTATLGLRRLERRHGAQVERFPADMHGHVLYLRPFLTEHRALFRLPRDRAEFTGQGLRRNVALDEFLARDVRIRLGPFVALGNPSEAVPPGGATRVYLDDDGWEQELMRLAVGARALVMEPGRAANLRWELEYVATKGLQDRLFIITPPRWPSWRWIEVATRMVDALTGWQTIAWSEFGRELPAGLDLPDDGPGPGAVVSFTSDGSPEVLAHDLRRPDEFVGVIAAHTGAPL